MNTDRRPLGLSRTLITVLFVLSFLSLVHFWLDYRLSSRLLSSTLTLLSPSLTHLFFHRLDRPFGSGPARIQPVTRKIDYEFIPSSSPSPWNFIILHGLGDYHASQAFEIQRALSKLEPRMFSGFNFIIPMANQLEISVFNRQIRPAWFDIFNWSDIHQNEDIIGLASSLRSLQALIDKSGINLSQTIIAGFSQGAVMSLLLALTLERQPHLAVMLSGYCPVPKELKSVIQISRSRRQDFEKIVRSSPANSLQSEEEADFRLHWFHGTSDPFLKIEFAKDGFKDLKKILYDPEVESKSSKGRSRPGKHPERPGKTGIILKGQAGDLDLEKSHILGGGWVTFEEIRDLDHNWNMIELEKIIRTIRQTNISSVHSQPP